MSQYAFTGVCHGAFQYPHGSTKCNWLRLSVTITNLFVCSHMANKEFWPISSDTNAVIWSVRIAYMHACYGIKWALLFHIREPLPHVHASTITQSNKLQYRWSDCEQLRSRESINQQVYWLQDVLVAKVFVSFVHSWRRPSCNQFLIDSAT